MVPESSQNREIALYRCDRFPDRWKREAVLIEGITASDSTLIYHNDRFWMFTAVENGRPGYFIAPLLVEEANGPLDRPFTQSRPE